jgi:transcriptional regulator with XRE-family HTH domain
MELSLDSLSLGFFPGLAQRLGQPQSFISKYESGERLLDLLELHQVCLAVGVELSQFIKNFEASLKIRRPKR